ncbi:hypothetical protein GCM10010532_002870 [Dactylosporangium siamense]|uniref:Uncharacterized protein n=1 Tax=Dactylosporangium siamense TaxID=685454 RepID=A0A919PLH2_9ACTN|nr:hypothetical protein Dsi01nite_022790 [Dactylosporangium siamense]
MQADSVPASAPCLTPVTCWSRCGGGVWTKLFGPMDHTPVVLDIEWDSRGSDRRVYATVAKQLGPWDSGKVAMARLRHHRAPSWSTTPPRPGHPWSCERMSTNRRVEQ